MLRLFADPVALLHVVELRLKPVKLLAPCKRTQQLPKILRGVCQQCCVRLHGAAFRNLELLDNRTWRT